jgi:hypothetical protein
MMVLQSFVLERKTEAKKQRQSQDDFVLQRRESLAKNGFVVG